VKEKRRGRRGEERREREEERRGEKEKRKKRRERAESFKRLARVSQSRVGWDGKEKKGEERKEDNDSSVRCTHAQTHNTRTVNFRRQSSMETTDAPRPPPSPPI